MLRAIHPLFKRSRYWHNGMVNLLIIVAALLLPPVQAYPVGKDMAFSPPVRLAQVRIQQHVVIRVPRPGPHAMPRVSAPAAPLPPIAWIEKDADKCIRMDRLSAAAITRADSVDLVMAGGKRVRAKLGKECPSLDFYSGFYVKPNKDGLVCAKRDTFRSRSGGECQIKAFRILVPGR